MRKSPDTDVEAALRNTFPEVTPEWDAVKDSRDALNRKNMYAPRIDFAVGPFNIDARTTKEVQKEIAGKVEEFAPLIQSLQQRSVFPDARLTANWNPRCFLAVEIEITTSRKHRLGGIFNASMLGAYGIVLAPDEKVLRSFKRLLNYVRFLEDVGKLDRAWRNTIIMTKDDFLKSF